MQRRSGKIEKKYARTLFELSSDDNAKYRAADLRKWVDFLAQVPELKIALENPAVPLDQRLALVNEICARCGAGDETLRNFVSELTVNGRIESLEAIAEAYQSLIDAAQGIVSVELISAFALEDEERVQLVAEMEQVLQKKISVRWSVDASLIGGVVIRSGDVVLDNSLKGALDRVRRELLA